ncbi:hypothetical protein [Cloacibacillus evryensis]|uniref:hypothetical protein n=1 Tax=Cloacibacillus evryensis TaxID=508460 RepID=UPI002B20BF57|nr:hypothetical protein [Cloacibacillus evryensis]MEA5034248.1 hypothetical protein [Cloacibacillus evryensis]
MAWNDSWNEKMRQYSPGIKNTSTPGQAIVVQEGGGFNPLGLLGTIASLAIPGAGPWIAGANALGSALSGDWAGAAKNAAGAFAGGDKAGVGSGQVGNGLLGQAESSPNYAGSGADGSTSAWAPKDFQVQQQGNNWNAGNFGTSPRPAQSESDKKYQGLLDMYGIGSTGQFDPDAAKNYYQTYGVGGVGPDTEDNAYLYDLAMKRRYGW